MPISVWTRVPHPPAFRVKWREPFLHRAEAYADFPLGGVDASVIALAERLDTPTVLTLDHCDSLQLLPA